VAGYLAARARALPLAEDLSPRMLYRGAAWQWAGQGLGGLFGPASELGRPVAAALIRRILPVTAPAVVDGQAELHRFAVLPDSGRTVKTDFDASVFTSLDLFCFDPAFDLAQAAVSARDDGTGERLRCEYEAETGRRVDPERWFLYRFVRVNEIEGGRPPGESLAERRLSPLMHRYFGEVLVANPLQQPAGPLCAIDLDGVLDTMPLGFAATSPLGAMALRSLVRHDFRPVLATGRSLAEVRDRCLAYGLAGGVAEYGAVIYDRQRDRTQVLLDDEGKRALDRLRAALLHLDGVRLDPDYRHSVRAFRFDSGRRRPLGPHVAERVIAAASAEGVLRPIQGAWQTDFAPIGVDKGPALQSLSEILGVDDRDKPLALAVGDSASDLGMLRLARAAYAPANADGAIRQAGVEVLRGPYQVGLAAAVARVIGHAPGGCRICAPPPFEAGTRLFLQLLSLQDATGLRKAARMFELFVLALRKGA
jgi:hydroxymethylpyrimidine pyrophosphatase-like HAD family hydrolase